MSNTSQPSSAAQITRESSRNRSESLMDRERERERERAYEPAENTSLSCISYTAVYTREKEHILCFILKEDVGFQLFSGVIFTFTHLADAFIQSNLQCIKAIHFFPECVSWELNPLPFALQTQCSTTEPQEQLYYCCKTKTKPIKNTKTNKKLKSILTL